MSSQQPGVIRRLFSRLATALRWLRIALFNLLFLLSLGLMFALFGADHRLEIPEQGALVLAPWGTVVDQRSYIDPLSELFGENTPQQAETLLSDLVEAIELAKYDDRINSLVIQTDFLAHAGISKISELAPALQSFRDTGKKIIAVADSYSQDQYLLAVQADEIYLHPMGGVSLQGYGLYRSYFKQALDKLSINFHVFRVGTYKSAVEPFLRDDMSAEAKRANLGWLQQLWADYRGQVVERRGLNAGDIQRYVDEHDQLLRQYQGNSATVAVAAGLVDGVKTRDQMNDYLVELVGGSDEDGYFQGIDAEHYLPLKLQEDAQSPAEQRVGVIVAAGNIVDGDHPSGVIGGDTLAALVREARRDAAVRALVLRVDSGGGSAFASEIIRRELELFQAEGKPLVISMGSMAASGGYWIAAGADEVWATPTTLTGSIGIFGAFPTLENSLSEIGISIDGVGTSKLAGAFRIDRPMQPMAASVIQQTIEHGYDRFLKLVAEGRDMPLAEVAKVAEGRVWSGLDAQRLGLVDQLGGLPEAIVSAAKLADITDYRSELIEVPLSPREQLLRQLTGVMVDSGINNLATSTGLGLHPQLQQLLQPAIEGFNFLQSMNDPRGTYLHCGSCARL